jgi:hypothetical protein
LKSLYLENNENGHHASKTILTNQPVFSHKLSQWKHYVSDNTVTTSITPAYVNCTPRSNLNITTSESNTVIQNNSPFFSKHKNFTESTILLDQLENEVRSHASHLACCLKSALCDQNFLEDRQDNKDFQNINESIVKEKYLNVFTSFSEGLMDQTHQNNCN